MVSELIQLPLRITSGVVGGVARAVLSRLEGERPPLDQPIRSRPIPRPEPIPEPTRPHPEATDWDPEAPVQPGGSSPDDLVITDRVKSELFAVVDAPKGELNLNVENGVLFIRGRLDDPEQIDDVVSLAAGVEGVVRVENLISR